MCIRICRAVFCKANISLDESYGYGKDVTNIILVLQQQPMLTGSSLPIMYSEKEGMQNV
jgi:hypothetical protein